MEYKELLIRLREQKGLSHRALAKELGVSRQTVYNWENGAATPSAENLLPRRVWPYVNEKR